MGCWEKVGAFTRDHYCGTHGRAAGWPCREATVANRIWSYDQTTGTLFCGSKAIAGLFPGLGNPVLALQERDRFGKMIVEKMNELTTKPRKPLGRTRDAK